MAGPYMRETGPCGVGGEWAFVNTSMCLVHGCVCECVSVCMVCECEYMCEYANVCLCVRACVTACARMSWGVLSDPGKARRCQSPSGQGCASAHPLAFVFRMELVTEVLSRS